MAERDARTAIRGACLLLVLSLAAPAFVAAERDPVVRGKALFTGAESMARGGAPCAACHAFHAGGVTGGNLASDLTDLYEGMGEEGLKEVLKSLDFPVMKRIYADRPLTDEEIASLIGFTRAAAAGKKSETSFLFLPSGFALFICCLAMLALYKRRIG